MGVCVLLTTVCFFVWLRACVCVLLTTVLFFVYIWVCVCVLLATVHLPLRMFSLLSVGRDMTYKVDWALKTSYLLHFFPVTVLWLHYSFCIICSKKLSLTNFSSIWIQQSLADLPVSLLPKTVLSSPSRFQ